MMIQPRRSRCRPIAKVGVTETPRPGLDAYQDLHHTRSKPTRRPPNNPKVVVILRRPALCFSGISLMHGGGSQVGRAKEAKPTTMPSIAGASPEPADNPSHTGAAKSRPRKKIQLTSKKTKTSRRQKPTVAARRGSKKAKIVSLLKRPGGASVKQLQKATGWQPHSVRGFISAQLKTKMALTVRSTKRPDGSRAYLLSSK